MEYKIQYNRGQTAESWIVSERGIQKEVEAYKAKMCRYGVPLDCRSDYAKTDWQAWTTVMTEDSEYTETVYRKIYDYINETVDRAPVSDWYQRRARTAVCFSKSKCFGCFVYKYYVE